MRISEGFMVHQLMVKRILGFVHFIVFLVYLSPVEADQIFKADPAVIENLKSILLSEQNVEDADNWRPVALFHVTGQYRPSFFSSKIEFDFEARVTLEESIYKGKPAYKGVFHFPGSTKTFVLRKSDLNPLYSQFSAKDGSFEVEVFFSEQEILFKETIQGDASLSVIEVGDIEDYYESELLGFVLLAFPFDFDGSQYFNMFYYERAKHYYIEANCQGVEQINVPAGEFTAYRLEVSPAGFLSLFSRNYVWYQKDPPHYFVKGEKNIWWYLYESWELIKVDKERRVDLH
jgi:hypothetical protein